MVNIKIIDEARTKFGKRKGVLVFFVPKTVANCDYNEWLIKKECIIMEEENLLIVNDDEIKNLIHTIRGKQVM